MVFKRNTLKNTKTFKQSTSINTSKINNPQPVKHIPTKKRTTYTAGSGSGGWAVSDSIKSILNPLPQVDATTTYDTNAGYADGKFQDDSKMSVYDENNPTQIHAESKFNLFDTSTWFGPPTQQYNTRDVAAEEQQQSPPPVTPDVTDEVKLDPYPDMQQGAYGRGFIENKDGSFTKATIKPGSTPSYIKDYVTNEQRTSYYNLPSDVSQSAHQAALDKQSMYKFENSIQKSYSTMLRGSGPGNRINEQNFLDLKSQINNSNISQGKKDNMISEYTNKISNYQKAAGGYGTANPWSFGTSSPKNPNKAEKLKQKIDSGTATEKDINQFKTLTGQSLYSGGIAYKSDGTIKPNVLTYKDLF